MYVNLVKRWLMETWDGMFPRGFRRSSALPVLIVLLVILLPLGAWMLHRAGKFGALKREIKGASQPPPDLAPMPGGMAPVVLTRTPASGSNMPEFRSATLLPGFGMQVLQISAYIPGRGEVNLLAAPSVKEMADGSTPMRMGPNDRWGAIEAPWAGVLTGALTPIGTTLRNVWHGHGIETPVNVLGRGIAEGGLLNTLGADSTQPTPSPDGSSVVALFKAVDFDNRWPSQTDFIVQASLGLRTINLTVTAKNVGQQPEPLGIGWHPRFLIPSKNRDGSEIRLPGGEQLEESDRSREIPSGKFVTPGASVSRFQIRPAVLGPQSLDEALVHLKAGLMDSGVSAEVRDPGSEFGIRLTALSDSIRELRVTSPAGSNYVGIGLQTNFDDPLGKEWTSVDGAAIPVLLPGQTAEWKIQIEIFPISGAPAPQR
jgi:hypothetical protein